MYVVPLHEPLQLVFVCLFVCLFFMTICFVVYLRLAEAVTPLLRLPYSKQLATKQSAMAEVLRKAAIAIQKKDFHPVGCRWHPMYRLGLVAKETLIERKPRSLHTILVECLPTYIKDTTSSWYLSCLAFWLC